MDRYDKQLADYSTVIKISRVLCIFFMSYVHVRLFNDPAIQNSIEYITASTILRDVLGRSSVPLLSVISGFLMVGMLRRKKITQVYLSRFNVLIVPMLFWGFAGFTVFSLLDGWIKLSINTFIPLTGKTSQIHLSFLRDLFIIALLTPLLVKIIKYTRYSALVIFVGCLFFDFQPFILRDQILAYYVVGLAIGLHGSPKVKHISTIAPVLLVVLTLFLISFKTGLTDVDIRSWSYFDDVLLRPLCALSMFYLAVKISRNAAMSAFFTRIEPAAYLMFLSHLITARIFAGVLAHISFSQVKSIYILSITVIPVLCYVLAFAGHRLIKQFPRPISIMIAGK